MVTENQLEIEVLIEEIYNLNRIGYNHIDYNDIRTFKKTYRPFLAITEQINAAGIEPFKKDISNTLTMDYNFYIVDVRASESVNRVATDSLISSLEGIIGIHGIKRASYDRALEADTIEIRLILGRFRNPGEDSADDEIEKALLEFRIQNDWVMPTQPESYMDTAINAYEKKIIEEIKNSQVEESYHTGRKMLCYFLPCTGHGSSQLPWDRLEKLVNLIVTNGKLHNVLPPYPPLNNVNRLDLEFDLYSGSAGAIIHQRLSGIHKYMMRLTNELSQKEKDAFNKLMHLYKTINPSKELSSELTMMLRDIEHKFYDDYNMRIEIGENEIRLFKIYRGSHPFVLTPLNDLAELYLKVGLYDKALETYKEMLTIPECSDFFLDRIENKVKELETLIKKEKHD